MFRQSPQLPHASVLQACASVQPVNPTASLRMKEGATVTCASVLQACASVQPVNPTASLRMKEGATVMCASVLQACASVQPVNPTASLRMRDAQGLVLWVLADGANPRWVFVKARPLGVPVVPAPALSCPARTMDQARRCLICWKNLCDRTVACWQNPMLSACCMSVLDIGCGSTSMDASKMRSSSFRGAGARSARQPRLRDI